MSRRPGQYGYIEKRGNSYYARFWLDEAGREKRTYKRVRICPVDGPGALNTSERKRRLKEIIAEFGANSEATFRKAESVNLGTTFKEQAEQWLKELKLRKRDPIKPSTASAFESHLNYIRPAIGEMPLSEVNNRTMKEFVSKMAAEVHKDGSPRFSPKSISNYIGVVKMVVASALNEDGDPIYPRKWNHEFMDLPTIDDQNTPSLTSEEIQTIIDQAEGQFPMLYAFLAGSGLRIGEALALRVENVRGSVIHVRQSLWQGHFSTPKTENGTREVDIHSSLAEALTTFIGSRTTGYVFRSARGTPLHKSNVLRRSLHPILATMERESCGFHSFRRFRTAHLRKQRVPEILLRIWIGHSTKGITDKYALEGFKQDVEFRSFTAEQAGLGLNLPQIKAELHPVAPSESFVSV